MDKFFSDLATSFYNNLILENRWLQLLEGLGVTLLISLFATLIGLVLGFVVAVIRSTYDMSLKGRKSKRFSDYVLKLFNALCNIYITVIRGTPVLIQVMIMYFIIFGDSRDGMVAAVLSFGINSGAYVAEIVRSGIMSIDKGQFEASRSLGFNYRKTMILVVLPQALKNVLPALGNEFIVLLKETSVAGYAATHELTYVGNIIRSRTYEAFFPLISVAAIYLVVVLILSYFLKRFERRLRSSDH